MLRQTSPYYKTDESICDLQYASKSDAHFTVENKEHSTHAHTTLTQAKEHNGTDDANVLSKFIG
jgi:hypothetical protein